MTYRFEKIAGASRPPSAPLARLRPLTIFASRHHAGGRQPAESGRTGGDRASDIAAGMAALASTAFFAVVLQISLADPGYFERLLVSDIQPLNVDPITTGAIGQQEADSGEPAMPVPTVARSKPLAPEEFEIVMVFGEEALLATASELWRVKVGSMVPGLGEVLAIDADGTIRTTEAILRRAVE